MHKSFISLFKDMKMLKSHRKEYVIHRKIKFERDTTIISVFPTIVIRPWVYRYINSYVVDIHWLHFHIGIGWWENAPEDK